MSSIRCPEALREAADETAARERMEKALANVEDDDLAITPGGVAAGLTRKAALGPVVAPPVTKRVGVEKAAPVSGLRSPVRAVILAIVVVFFPVILVFVLFVKPERLPAEGVAKMGTTASAQALSVAEAGVGLPEGGAAAVPVMPPEASSAVVPVAPPAATSAASGEPAPVKPKIKSKDPHEAAPQPNPPKTSAPTAPDVPTARPSAEPEAPPVKTADPPPAEPTGPRGLPYRKKDQ
jgi:hypothetical protein